MSGSQRRCYGSVERRPRRHSGVRFDVVGFSEGPTTPSWNAERIARAWEELMQRLGYSRWFAQGGAWGAYVTTAMAQLLADQQNAIAAQRHLFVDELRQAFRRLDEAPK
jgi:pimeloyl-ACP methyl ester carboxylesterase